MVNRERLMEFIFDFIEKNPRCSTRQIEDYLKNDAKSNWYGKLRRPPSCQQISMILRGEKRVKNLNFKIHHTPSEWVLVT